MCNDIMRGTTGFSSCSIAILRVHEFFLGPLLDLVADHLPVCLHLLFAMLSNLALYDSDYGVAS